MPTTRQDLSPLSANLSGGAALLKVGERWVLAFDASSVESASWTFRAPQGLSGSLSLVVSYFMASATSGNIDFEASVEAISEGDAHDLDAGTYFSTVNTMTADAVPATQGYMGEFTISLTNADSIAAGDVVTIKLERDADDATNDTASGDCYVWNVELREA